MENMRTKSAEHHLQNSLATRECRGLLPTVQDSQGVQIVHSSCYVNQTPADRVLQHKASWLRTGHAHLKEWNVIKGACDYRLQAVHWLATHKTCPTQSLMPIAQGQYPEAERWLTRSRQFCAVIIFCCTRALSRLPLSAYSKSIHVSRMS